MGLSTPEPVQQVRLALIEGAPLTPARFIADRVIGVSIPAGGVARLRVDGPVAALDALGNHPVDERVLPGRIDAGRDVAPAVAVADAGLAQRPVHVAAELTHHDGVVELLQIAE